MTERIWDLYCLKQVYGLHKEELEKAVHSNQKLDTEDPKEKYVCVWSYVYDFFFYSLGCLLAPPYWRPLVSFSDIWDL